MHRQAGMIRLALVCAAVAALLLTGGCRRKKYENPIDKDTQQPDKVLFDKAINDIEKGRYEIARLTLNTLLNTYDTSEYTAKAKLAIADSWMREGGSHALAQAEAEYKDFILFYPTMEESAEAQMKVCDIHFKQMQKADRDTTHMLRADEECRQLLTQFPNSRFAPEASQRVRQVQEVIADGEYRVGTFYYGKGSFPASANRLQAVTDHYPLFSNADDALFKLGDAYSKMPNRFRDRSIQAFQRLVREYPLSPYLEDAKTRLKAMEAEIPEPDAVAYARMKYEMENRTEPSFWSKRFGFLTPAPDTSRAAKSGQPADGPMRPTIPVSVPVPGGQTGGVTDVTASPVGTNPTALDTNPDARMSKQGEGQAPAAGTPPPAGTPAPEGTAPAAEGPKLPPEQDPGLVNSQAGLPTNQQGQAAKSDKKQKKSKEKPKK